MNRPPLRLIQIVGVAAGLLVGGGSILNAAWGQPPLGTEQLLYSTLTLAIWAACYWKLCDRIRVGSMARWDWALFVIEILAALIHVELLIIMSAQVPMVVPERKSWRVLLLLESVILVIAVLASLGDFEASDTYRNLPRLLAQVMTTVEIMLWAAFAFAAGLIIVRFEMQRRQLMWTNAELLGTRQLLIDSSRSSERVRIARELHDSLGHHLVSIGLNLEVAQRKANAEALPAIEKSQLLSRLLLAEVRDAVAQYREDRMVRLDDALELLLSSCEDPKVDAELALPTNLSSLKAHTLFRACEEALTNIRKHSRATRVQLQIRQDLGRIHLLIHDNGVGGQDIEPGNGLKGMRERFSEAGGSLGWQTKPGGGFLVAGWLPAEEPTL